MATIVINSVGTLGDLNPFRLLAIELVRKGHAVKFGTLAIYREQLEAEGVQHFSVRPELEVSDPQTLKKALDPRTGGEFLFKQVLDPIRQTYEDLAPVCEKADVMVGGSLSFIPSLIHERKKIPWVSIGLQPTAFASEYQFPVVPQALWLRHPPFNHPVLMRVLKKMLRAQTNKRSTEWTQLRAELGVSERPNIVFDAPLSPRLQLAAYSPLFNGRQKDWPANRLHTGFIQPGLQSEKLSPELDSFLSQGEPPVVFTLGSTAVLLGQQFFHTCLEVIQKLKIRSVLVCGKWESELKAKAAHIPQLFISGHEPYSALFPRARLAVHQGGMGTIGESLRAGTPMIIVPFGGPDSYDNGCHIVRIGCGDWCPIQSLTASKLEALIARVSRPQIQAASRRLKEEILKENGLDEAVRHIESLVRP